MQMDVIAVDEAEEISKAFDDLMPYTIWNVPTSPRQKIIPWVIMRLAAEGKLVNDSRG